MFVNPPLRVERLQTQTGSKVVPSSQQNAMTFNSPCIISGFLHVVSYWIPSCVWLRICRLSYQVLLIMSSIHEVAYINACVVQNRVIIEICKVLVHSLVTSRLDCANTLLCN